MILTEIFRTSNHGPDLHFLVELRGFEPLTASMRTRLPQVHRPKLQKPWSAAPYSTVGSGWAGSPRRRPPNSSQLIKEEGSVGDAPAGSRYLCISRVRERLPAEISAWFSSSSSA